MFGAQDKPGVQLDKQDAWVPPVGALDVRDAPTTVHDGPRLKQELGRADGRGGNSWFIKDVKENVRVACVPTVAR